MLLLEHAVLTGGTYRPVHLATESVAVENTQSANTATEEKIAQHRIRSVSALPGLFSLVDVP